ncbi:MAG: hypothetical protein Q4A81_08840, partial [Pasteurellaceae bacterium]|nr:hypothetical protein [Pasteurellaceae bacterium]
LTGFLLCFILFYGGQERIVRRNKESSKSETLLSSCQSQQEKILSMPIVCTFPKSISNRKVN